MTEEVKKKGRVGKSVWAEFKMSECEEGKGGTLTCNNILTCAMVNKVWWASNFT